MRHRPSPFCLVLALAADGLILAAPDAALAQATGQVAVNTGAPASSRSLESLQQLLLSPPEPRLNVILAPRFQYEQFDAYTEDLVLVPSGEVIADGVAVPEFDIKTVGASLGLEYLLPNGFFVGSSVSYNNTDYDFDVSSPEEVVPRLFTEERSPDVFFGTPVNREFDEYGASLTVGYLKDPISVILSGGYSYRDISTIRREFKFALAEGLPPGVEYEFLEGETHSHNFSLELGAAYRFEVVGGSFQPLVVIGYRREETSAFADATDTGFFDLDLDPSVPGSIDFEELVLGEPPVEFFDPSSRRFGDDTIESIPLTVGFLMNFPLGSETGQPELLRFNGVTTGLSYTHDFEDQERTIVTDSLFYAADATFEERNRNEDFISLTGAVDLGLFYDRILTTASWQGDFGFDERERADIFRLQFRVPM